MVICLTPRPLIQCTEKFSPVVLSACQRKTDQIVVSEIGEFRIDRMFASSRWSCWLLDPDLYLDQQARIEVCVQMPGRIPARIADHTCTTLMGIVISPSDVVETCMHVTMNPQAD